MRVCETAPVISHVRYLIWCVCSIVEVGSLADLAAAILLTDSELDGRKIFVRPDREEAGYGHSGTATGGGSGKSTLYGGGGRGRATSGDGVSLYVGNLAYSVTWQSLKDLFATCGEVLRADVATEPSGRSKGFGIVKMSSQKAANKAIGSCCLLCCSPSHRLCCSPISDVVCFSDSLHNTDFEGRALIVREDTRA